MIADMVDALAHAVSDIRSRLAEADDETRARMSWVEPRIAAIEAAARIVESYGRIAIADGNPEAMSVRARLSALAPARGHFPFATEAARALEDVLSAQARIAELEAALAAAGAGGGG